ncbi:MAG: hypothetical protein KDJ52_20115 [Anaerolineae bacterium]|nr:hypothetical protein [Anaerolineae bacterium]
MELNVIKSATAIRRVSVVRLPSRFQTKAHDLTWLVLVGLCVSAVYLILLPYVERTWRPTGDEPHYLLTAHSLVHDFDFDLTNNYNQFDYLDFYYSKDIVRQVRIDAAGHEILDHHLGLPLLIAPAYALGGRYGVLAFQSLVAGLLAALTFKLAWYVSNNEVAALISTGFVFFSPPLLLYPYLVYPELVAALLTTIVLYVIITARLTPWTAMLVIGALILLPWLNRRFIPLALVLALLTVWSNWSLSRAKDSLLPRRQAVIITGLGVVLTVISIGLLLWFNSQLSTPARADVVLPPTGGLLWRRLARGVGWLVDQQRGLFVFAPIYMIAVCSLPLLLRDFWRHRSLNWVLLVPFVLSLGLTAAAGGFWVAWELGPRFLVVALPALAPLLALAWQTYRHSKLFVGVAMLLFGLSLSNGIIILRQPELPYKSSLPLFYSQALNLPITDWLPNLGDYETLYPTAADNTDALIIEENNESFWFAEAGKSRTIIGATALDALSFGHYHLRWPVGSDVQLPPETELLRLSIKHAGGGQVAYKTVTAAELPTDGTFGVIDETFFNPDPDRWRTTLVFQATSLGAGNVWAGPVRISPDWFYAWLLPYLYVAIIIAAAIILWLRYGQKQPNPDLAHLPRQPTIPLAYAWSAAIVVPIMAVSYVGWQHGQPSHTYAADTFQHFVGQAVPDDEATASRAWLVDPAVDPPQKAIYGPFDIYDAGDYTVTFRLKLPEAVEVEPAVARLQVSATASFDELAAQDLFAADFTQPDQYQTFTLAVTNPRRQALSFEVAYSGVAPLYIDNVTITETHS